MSNKIADFFMIMFGPDYPGQLAIFAKQNKTTKLFKNSQMKKVTNFVADQAVKSDVYFGCGLLDDQKKAGRGKVEDVIALSGFWMDIAVEENSDKRKNLPSTREEALEILKEFPMKPTLIVDYVNGLQVYWLFKKLWEFIDPKEKNRAITISKKFQKAICNIFENHGYELSKSSSLATVLRIPDTINHEMDSSTQVKLIKKRNEHKRRYVLKDFTTAIKKCKKKAKPREYEAFRNPDYDLYNFPMSKVERILDHCQWLSHCEADSRQLTDKEKISMLTLIAFCKDAESWACRLSANNDGYDEEETLVDLNSIQRSHKNPVTCHYIKENYPGYCDGCTHKVKSPFSLGIKISQSVLEQVGFIYNDMDILKSINGNVFARYILTRYNLLFTTGDRFYEYRDGVWHFVSENLLARQLRDLIHEFAPDFWNKYLEEKYMDTLRLEAPFETSMDRNRDYLNLVNGMLNLKTYQLEPHHPDFRSSVQIPISFNENAKCSNFNKFLNDVFEGDKQRIKVMKEIMGYCLTAETSAQKAFLLYGKGANGKSLLAEILMNLCGQQNVSAIPLADLENPFNRYELVGKLLNLATENEISSDGLNTAPFKAIVSGDAIQVEKKYESSFLYQPFCKLVFSLNNLPYSRDKSWGFHRRLIVIPFNRTFREDDPETKNYDELKAELMTELDGILNASLKGLKRLRKNKYRFSYSKEIDAVLEEYKQMLNPYTQFVEEALEQGDETNRVGNELMCKVFRRWCGANGHDRLGKSSNMKMLNEIRDALRDAKIVFDAGKGCKSGGNRYTGRVRIKTKEAKEAEDDNDLI